MTRRVDRNTVNGRTIKHHVQTLCVMDHLDFRQRGTHAYAQLFLVAQRLKIAEPAMEQVFLRMRFNVMARNCDDHTKNFAFRLKQGSDWELAPAYDVPHARNQCRRHGMGQPGTAVPGHHGRVQTVPQGRH